MHVGFFIIGIISSFLWTYQCTGAIPSVTFTASSSPYFDIGGSMSFACSINEDVHINNVFLRKDGVQYVWIQMNSPSSCVLYSLTDPDPHVYSVTCEQQMTVHIVMNGTVATDHNATWSCEMSAESGICNNPCISTSSVTTALRGVIPTVTMTASSSPYFDIGGSISLACSINADVNINNAYLTKDGVQYVWIQIKSPSDCGLIPMTGKDPHVYSVACEQRMIVHIVMNGTVSTDHNATWSCEMTAESGICNPQPCMSTTNVTTALRVPVSSVQLTDGNGQPLVTPVPIFDGSSKVVQCDTFPNGSRPRALFNWYKRSENQSPILIQGQSVSTRGPKPEDDLSMSISYSTLTLMGSRSYQNMYIYCEARDETNRGNVSRSTEVQLNILYGADIIHISVAEGNTVNENTTATLRCLVDSNPESNITWIKQGIMGALQTNLYVYESQFIIEHADCLDTSNYTCNARNGVGQPVERMVPLYVTCHPRTDFRSPSVTTVYSKRYGIASLKYTVISFPEPIFNWSFIGNGSESRSLPDSATKHDSGLQSVLIFKNLSINDFGFYRVIAKNKFPISATEMFQLIPADVPDIPCNVTVTDVKQTSLTVQWVAGYDGGLKQTFHIMIKASDITRSVYAPDPGYGKSGTRTIEDLIPNTEYSISMSTNNSLGSSSVTNVQILITLKAVEGIPANLGIPVAGIAGGVSAGFVLILVMGLSIFLWRRSQQKKQNEDENDVMRKEKGRSVGHDSASGQEYEGLHLTRGEASPYLHTNDIRLEENRDANTRTPEIDSYETVHHYTNNDIQLYSPLKIPKIATDSERMYENAQIR